MNRQQKTEKFIAEFPFNQSAGFADRFSLWSEPGTLFLRQNDDKTVKRIIGLNQPVKGLFDDRETFVIHRKNYQMINFSPVLILFARQFFKPIDALILPHFFKRRAQVERQINGLCQPIDVKSNYKNGNPHRLGPRQKNNGNQSSPAEKPREHF